ncbi:MAG: sigma-70 factor domain-containing protein [Solirubrobacteraceae bacterium]
MRLLTAQEEVDLAKRIERGDPDAKQKMVESNLRKAAAKGMEAGVGSCVRAALSRPSPVASLRSARPIWLSFSTMWTGIRIVRALSASARAVAWRIHQVA